MQSEFGSVFLDDVGPDCTLDFFEVSRFTAGFTDGVEDRPIFAGRCTDQLAISWIAGEPETAAASGRISAEDARSACAAP